MCCATNKLRLEGSKDTTLFGNMAGREITFFLLSAQDFALHYLCLLGYTQAYAN